MAIAPLAVPSDVAATLGRDLTSTEAALVGPILDKASALFRAESGQTFTVDESTVRLRVTGGRVMLTQRPALTVVTVVDDDGDAVEYTQSGQWLTLTDTPYPAFVTVNYTHGDYDVPDLVRLTVAEVAARVLSIDPEARSGRAQVTETSGPFSQNTSFASWAVGGQTMLSPDDKAIARTFRAVAPRVWVQQS